MSLIENIDNVLTPSFKVASYNLLHDAPTYPKGEALLRLKEGAEHVRDTDVVLIQEVGKFEDGRLASTHLADLLGMTVAIDTPLAVNRFGEQTYTSIITSLPVLWSGHVNTGVDDISYPAAIVEAPSGRPVLVISVHLMWGGDAEYKRVAQIVALEDAAIQISDEWFEKTGVTPVAVIGGDFNTDAHSETLRVATGVQSFHGRSFKWTEAMDTVGRENWVGPLWSQQPGSNWLAARTAEGVGIMRPDMLTDRRIDFILTRGWAYGRPGCPVAGETRGYKPVLSDNLLASDHNIIIVDLFDPEV